MAGDVVYGVHAVREALQSGRRVNRVYFARESRARSAAALVDEARERRVPFDFVPQAKLNELTGTRDHQGVAATVSPLEYAALEEVLAEAPPQCQILVLDQIQHPRNLGMMIRSAAGAGARAVLAPARGGALVDDTVVRASAGTVSRVPLVACGNLPQTLRRLREAGFWVYGLDARGEQDVFQVDWPERVALVVGNETSGMRPGVAKACDAKVRIPLAGGVESLNAAVAASVVLFQVFAHHARGG